MGNNSTLDVDDDKASKRGSHLPLLSIPPRKCTGLASPMTGSSGGRATCLVSPYFPNNVCLAQLVFCMTKGARGGEGDEVLGTVRRQAPVHWANMQSNWRCSQYCDPPLSCFASDQLLFPSHQSRGHRSSWRFRGRSQPGWEPDVVNNRERFSSSRMGERRRKLLMRVSTFGALKSPKAFKSNARNDRSGSWSPVSWHFHVWFCLFQVRGHLGSWTIHFLSSASTLGQ